jgi:hypothetical protein
VLVGYIHDSEATEVFLGLDERTIGEQRRAGGRVDTEHGGGIVQAAGEDQDSGSLHLCHQRPDSLGLLAQLLVRVVGHPLVVEGDEVLGHVSSLPGWLLRPPSTLSTNGGGPVRHHVTIFRHPGPRSGRGGPLGVSRDDAINAHTTG